MLELLIARLPDYCVMQLAVIAFYSTVYFLTNGNDLTARFLLKYKFNKSCACWLIPDDLYYYAHPPTSLVNKEILRLCSSVFVCYVWECLLIDLQRRNPALFTFTGDGDLSRVARTFPALEELMTRFPLVIGIFLWADAHFYFTHRLLHAVPFLYRNVHSIHHQSKNPDAYSGLSFHPLEAAIYFSSFGLLPFLVPTPLPISFLNTFKWGLLLSPVGHASFGPLPHGGKMPVVYEDHYLHHLHVNVNFASGLLPYYGIWDNLLGTRYVPPDRESKGQ